VLPGLALPGEADLPGVVSLELLLLKLRLPRNFVVQNHTLSLGPKQLLVLYPLLSTHVVPDLLVAADKVLKVGDLVLRRCLDNTDALGVVLEKTFRFRSLFVSSCVGLIPCFRWGHLAWVKFVDFVKVVSRSVAHTHGVLVDADRIEVLRAEERIVVVFCIRLVLVYMCHVRILLVSEKGMGLTVRQTF
jgi:hypothetical protein